MNLSSVLIIAKDGKEGLLEEKIKAIKDCSVELKEGQKFVVVIESENLDSELKAYKALEALKEAISVNMIFSHQDLDEDLAKIAENTNLNEKIDTAKRAEDIEYYGSVFEKY